MIGRRIWTMIAAIGFMLSATQAEAKRTLVDQDPNGDPAYTPIGGYCDFNGEDCGTTALGFTIDFSGGPGPISNFIFYGNGMISFGDTPVVFDPVPVGGDAVIIPSPNDLYLTPGLNNFVQTDNQFNGGVGRPDLVFFQSADVPITRGTDGSITVNWSSCFGTSACDPIYSATIIPRLAGSTLGEGLEVVFDLGDFPLDYQPQISFPEFTDLGAARYFIPGTVSNLVASVPEPSTWAMMMIGFGAMGMVLRRRREGAGEAMAAFA